jgi:hypothetical protein
MNRQSISGKPKSLGRPQIEATSGLQPLSAEKLHGLWIDLRAKYLQAFTVTSAEARDRRTGTLSSMALRRKDQIGQCLKEESADFTWELGTIHPEAGHDGVDYNSPTRANALVPTTPGQDLGGIWFRLGRRL